MVIRGMVKDGKWQKSEVVVIRIGWLLLLLPGGIIPGCVRVTFSFALRGHAPTHLAIPTGKNGWSAHGCLTNG